MRLKPPLRLICSSTPSRAAFSARRGTQRSPRSTRSTSGSWRRNSSMRSDIMHLSSPSRRRRPPIPPPSAPSFPASASPQVRSTPDISLRRCGSPEKCSLISRRGEAKSGEKRDSSFSPQGKMSLSARYCWSLLMSTLYSSAA